MNNTSKDIDEILTNLKNGNQSALKDLYDSLHRQVYFLSLSILRNQADAEDAVQNTFLAINESIYSYKDSSSGKSWVLMIARNKALDIYRRNSRIVKLELNALASFEEGHEEEYSDIFEKILLELNTKERQIVFLHLMLDITHKEISKIIKMPQGSVRRNYANAINKLKTIYKDKEIL